jgi:[methyl-Co(III) methanol-specific corrinoid protein]:coenzyme M methyltransferase
MFERYALHYLNRLADRVHKLGIPFILHICGNIRSVRKLLPQLHADALSTDALVNLPALKREFPSITTMGNVSTFALQWSSAEQIRTVTRRLIDDGVNIISPACGLSTSTSLTTIRAMTDEARKGNS